MKKSVLKLWLITSVSFSTRSFCSTTPTKCLYDLKYLEFIVKVQELESGASLGFKQEDPPNPLMATHPCATLFSCISKHAENKIIEKKLLRISLFFEI
jgi:hypothetical protein